jgi:hypothetical protein
VSCAPHAEFPARADDNIADIYWICDDELEEAVQEILEKCGRGLPDMRSRKQPIVLATVGDLVLFVASCPSSTHATPMPAFPTGNVGFD